MGISRTQVRYFMTIRKYQLGVIVCPVLILFASIILIQSMKNARNPATFTQHGSPPYQLGIGSPVSESTSTFCPVPACAIRHFTTGSVCGLRQDCVSTNTIQAINVDFFCRRQDTDDLSVYRFIKTDIKKRVKRAVRRLLRWVQL